ncbi:protein-disulfide reductase DsbD domain-containing protein [Nevskia sp.]|uniref:protein-disulfide reductase DsbD family protein n=1 Tax=Nevskia sp. TaxID=1929292 RepID=UPI0025E17121|nr:protein-disulfide reductase DsbD domain-containing protein [Nevskia sp.]
MRFLPYIAAAVACAGLLAAPAQGAAVETEHVTAELIAENTALAAGADNTLALRLVPEHGWHIYWRNPGDSGKPTSIAWVLPDGLQAGELQWPYPHRESLGDIVNYGYSDAVLMPVTLAVPQPLPAGVAADQPLRLKAKARWLVCKDLCIPGSAELELALPIAEKGAPTMADERWRDAFARTRAALPQPAPADWTLRFQVHAEGADKALALAIRRGGISSSGELSFFPYASDLIAHSAPTRFAQDADGNLRLSQKLSDYFVKAPDVVEGVLVVHDGDTDKAWEIRATLGPVAVVPASAAAPTIEAAATSAPPVEPINYFLVLLFALVGGLVLNLMPCVFPVLSIKAISLVEARGATARRQRAHALAYTAGVLLTFTGLAALLLILRSTGSAIGWGFQLQHPVFIAGLAYLFFAMGLSLSGVVEFGTQLMGVGQSLADGSGYRSSFFTGVLAVAVASPCTAPFMGTALGYALSQPAPVALSVFVALGLGLALPFLLIGFHPPLAKALPRPGKWMETFKQFMAFPLYLTTIWLLWVLGGLTDRNGMTVALLGLTLIAFALWLWNRPGKVATVVKLAAVAGALALLANPLMQKASAGPSSVAHQGNVEPYSDERLAQLRAEGRTVFVNFTADWCITCKVNERVALDSASVKAAFAERNVVWLVGDWTREDPLITRTLERFGRSGVPLYLLYGDGAEPQVLPQVLTPATVLAALPPLKTVARQP